MNGEIPASLMGLGERLKRLQALRDKAPKDVPDEALKAVDAMIETTKRLMEHPDMPTLEARVLARGLRELAETIAPDKPAVPKANDIYQDKETAPVPNNPYSHFVAEAIAKGGLLARFITDGWRENTIDGQPQLLKQAAPWRGGSMLARFDPVEQQAVNAGELWAKVEGLNPLTADVAMAILGTLGDPRQGAKPKYPMLEPVHAGTRNSDH